MVALDEAVDALSAWGIQSSRPLKEIHPGRVFRVHPVVGDALILKDVGEHAMERLLFEIDVLKHLSNSGVPVAVPLTAAQGQCVVDALGTRFTLSPCLVKKGDPEPAGWEERIPGYGAAFARLHLALATYPTEGLAEKTWSSDPLSETYEICLPRLLGSLEREVGVPLSEKMSSIESEMRSALEGLPVQLIHRDLHDNNILCSGDRVVGFIDCDHLSLGSPIIDIAYFLQHSVKWLEEADGTMINNEGGTTWWFSWMPKLLQAYAQVRPLSSKEWASLPYVMIWVMIMVADQFKRRGDEAVTNLYLNLFDFVFFNRLRIREHALAV
jgi:Ser/Thr protein kinase RdoA (MazF antagonist)